MPLETAGRDTLARIRRATRQRKIKLMANVSARCGTLRFVVLFHLTLSLHSSIVAFFTSFSCRRSFSLFSSDVMAATQALAERRIVSLILEHLSDMKYKERRQSGPDQPVEFLEFRPTLVPSILVNKLWANEGTSVLWKRYPHLPALREMQVERQLWYANKVERLFVMSPSPDEGDDMTYLEPLEWPNLKYLELEVDWKRHGNSLQRMLHAKLEHLELSAPQSGGSRYITEQLLPNLFTSCNTLRSIHIGPEAISPSEPVHHQALSSALDNHTTIKDVSILNTSFFGKDLLFSCLSQRAGLEALDIDLDPGLQLLPLLRDSTSSHTLFRSLRRLHVMLYPEIALELPAHLPVLEKLSLDIARIPNCPAQDSDFRILNDLLSALVQCPRLEQLKVNVGQLASDFPSFQSLPVLDGALLVKLATACSNLKDVNLLASEPAAIDASDITAAQFEEFCRLVPQLTHLSMKLHPRTALALEESALHSLARHCPRLELLRLKVALQLPSLLSRGSALHSVHNADNSSTPPGVEKNSREGLDDETEVEHSAVASATPLNPQFPHLIHLALARSQTVLSVAASTYAASLSSKSSSLPDPWLEEELVRCWAQPLLQNFPQLDVLEAWGDWTGQDNDSLNYFLPIEEPLASIWEFLSGVEQDLWDDGEDDLIDEPERWDEDFEDGISFRGSGDWDRASLINEFSDINGSGYLGTYDEEPDDMVTPIDGREHWLADPNGKLPAAAKNLGDICTSEDVRIRDLEKELKHVTIHPRAGGQQV
jgi:hypothetical protein